MPYEQCRWAESCFSLTCGTVCAQNVTDAAINDWRKQLRAFVHADGQHFEHLLLVRVTDKSYGQIKYKYLKKTLLYCRTCDFRGLKVPQGKVRTASRWGGISDHFSMAYLLSNISAKNYCNPTTLVEIIVGGWVVPFFETLCSSGHQPNFAALNRGRHLYSAGRPSRWALAHILVTIIGTPGVLLHFVLRWLWLWMDTRRVFSLY